MYKIQRGVPLPRTEIPPRSGRVYPFATMQVDDMFFVPHREKNNLGGYVWAASRKHGCKFSTRMTWMKLDGECWVPADKSDPAAVRGIGVWRKA